jgi:hypothetical protein
VCYYIHILSRISYRPKQNETDFQLTPDFNSDFKYLDGNNNKNEDDDSDESYKADNSLLSWGSSSENYLSLLRMNYQSKEDKKFLGDVDINVYGLIFIFLFLFIYLFIFLFVYYLFIN